MPPKPKGNKGKGTASDSPSEIFEIDIGKIPKDHRATVDFNKPYAKHSFISAVYCIRILSSIGTMLGLKRAVDDKIKGYQDLFLLTIINQRFVTEIVTTEIVISLSDIYLYGVLCNGKWLYIPNEFYSIKGGEAARFLVTYSGKKSKVGIEVVRNCVDVLSNSDPIKWSEAYHLLAVNIAESVRFDAILRVFNDTISVTHVGGKLRRILNEWTNLSKLWKIFCECKVWNPQGHPCEVVDANEAELFLGIVKNMEVTEKEMKPKGDDDKKGDQGKKERDKKKKKMFEEDEDTNTQVLLS